MNPVLIRALPLAAMMAALSCGGGDRQAGDTPVGPLPTPTPDPVALALASATTACFDDPSALACRQALESFGRLPEAALPGAIGELLVGVCDRSAESCTALAAQLVRIGRASDLAGLVGRLVPAAGGDDGIPDGPRTVLDLLCSPRGSWPACEAALSSTPALDAVAPEYRVRHRLWGALRAGLDAPVGQGPSVLASGLEDGAADLRRLLALLALDPALAAESRDLVRETVAHFGSRGRDAVAAAIREDRLPVAMVAAYAGWDPGATEREARIATEEPSRTMTLDEAHTYVGRSIRLHHRNGSVRVGILKAVEDDVFVVEMPIGGGAMITRVDRRDIVRIQF